MTGAELVAALEAMATELGVGRSQLSGYKKQRLDALSRTLHPTQTTIERFKAIIEGRPPRLTPPRVARDPCPRCGTRRDFGCAHFAPAEPELAA